MATYLYNAKDGYSYKKTDLIEQIKTLLVKQDQITPANNPCLQISVKMRDSELPMAIYGFTSNVQGKKLTRLEEATKGIEECLGRHPFYPDWAMTTDQKTCPLTLDDYEEPYLLI